MTPCNAVDEEGGHVEEVADEEEERADDEIHGADDIGDPCAGDAKEEGPSEVTAMGTGRDCGDDVQGRCGVDEHFSCVAPFEIPADDHGQSRDERKKGDCGRGLTRGVWCCLSHIRESNPFVW